MKGIKFYHLTMLLLISHLATQFLIIPGFSMIGVLGSTLLLFLCLIGFEWICRKIARETENIDDFGTVFKR